MARDQEHQVRVEESFNASTIKEQKAFIFAVAWRLRKELEFRKFPKVYDLAKANIGLRSMIFGVQQWPKDQDYRKEKNSRQMRLYYQLLEKSLNNEEGRVQFMAESLLLWHSPHYHKAVSLETCESLWWDTKAEIKAPDVPYSPDSQAIARKVFDSEDLEQSVWVLCDSLEDTGHDAEVAHFRSGDHTPACPILRAIGGIK